MPATSQPGTCGSDRARLAAGEPQVHVVQGAGDGPHGHVAGTHRRVGRWCRSGRSRVTRRGSRPASERTGTFCKDRASRDLLPVETRRRSRVRPMDDAALVEAARSGDGSAWGAIYDRYADKLHDHCHRILRDRDEAADALHDAFIAASQHLDQLRDPTRLRPWLYSICRHEALRRARQRSRVELTDEVDEMSGVEVDLDRGTAHDGAPGARVGGGRRPQPPRPGAARPQPPSGARGPGPGRRHGDVAQQLLRDAQPPARPGGALARCAAHRPARAGGLRRARRDPRRVGTGGSPRCSASEWPGTSTAATSARERRAAVASPLALLAAAPLVPAPAQLRARVARRPSGPTWPVPPVRFTQRRASPRQSTVASADARLVARGRRRRARRHRRRPGRHGEAATIDARSRRSSQPPRPPRPPPPRLMPPTTTTVPATTTTTGARQHPDHAPRGRHDQH